MTDGAFIALVFVLSNLVDWLVSLISPLAYLPPCGGYFAHPFAKWVILLLISAFSRSWRIHRRMTVDPQQQLEQVCPQLLALEALKRV